MGNGSFTAFKDERLTMLVVVSIQSQLFITHLCYILRYNSEVIGWRKIKQKKASKTLEKKQEPQATSLTNLLEKRRPSYPAH